MMPSRNTSSSMVETCCAVCCHLPRGSVNRRSTYSTECSVSISSTLPTPPSVPAGLLAMYGFPVLVSIGAPAIASEAGAELWPALLRSLREAARNAFPLRVEAVSSLSCRARWRPRRVRRCGCGSPPRPRRRRSCRRRCGRCGRKLMIASTARSSTASSQTTSIFTLGRKSTTYSAPRYSSVWPFCRPKPFASTTVMPCRPTSCSASFTSSSLNGLMMASIFFMRVQRPGRPGLPCLAARHRSWTERQRQRVARGVPSGKQVRKQGFTRRPPRRHGAPRRKNDCASREAPFSISAPTPSLLGVLRVNPCFLAQPPTAECPDFEHLTFEPFPPS